MERGYFDPGRTRAIRRYSRLHRLLFRPQLRFRTRKSRRLARDNALRHHDRGRSAAQPGLGHPVPSREELARRLSPIEEFRRGPGMLKVRVIPTLLWKQFGLVKGVAFDSWRRVGPVLPAIRVYNQREVDELVLLDIAAHRKYDDPDYESIAEFGQDCFVPLTVGGGITGVDPVGRLLRSGADKVSVNTAAYARPAVIDEIAGRYGAQCVLASIDVRRSSDGGWRCFSHAGAQDTGREVCSWAAELEARGA